MPLQTCSSDPSRGSYGSLGSHGSYSDGPGLGSSYGSLGDSNNFHAFNSPAGPSGMNLYEQSGISILGNSPDTRRVMHPSHGGGIGFSPINFAPMSLCFPSQLTPPSSYGHISAGSPRHYGPSSLLRGSCHGSPLGKMASGSHYNRRKNWHGNYQSQESASSSNSLGNAAEINFFCQPEGNSPVFIGSSPHRQANMHASTWRPQDGGRSVMSNYSSSHMQTVQGNAIEKHEASNLLPDPGDWDPNYRQDGPVQSSSFGEAAIRGYAHTSNPSYFSPHVAPNWQQPVQRHNIGR